MLITMLADRFDAGGVLRAKGTQVDVATSLALQWIGDGVATDVGNSRETAQGLRKDVPVEQDRVSGQQRAGDSPVSGAGAALAAANAALPSVWLTTHSKFEQGFVPPTTSLGGTSTQGSYLTSPSDTKNVGVTDIYPENPMRMKFRGGAHGFPAKAQIKLGSLSSGYWAAGRRYNITSINAGEVTCDGIDATGMPGFTSAGASTDAMAFVDMAAGNWGPESHLEQALGFPFGTIDGCMIPGATTTQLAAQVPRWPNGRWDIGIINGGGRNNTVFDEAALITLRDWHIAHCGVVVVFTDWPDAHTGNGWTQAMSTLLKQEAGWWYAQAAAYPQIFIVDSYADLANPALTYQGGDPAYYATEGGKRVHPNYEGAALIGKRGGSDLAPVLRPLQRQAAGRYDNSAGNLLMGADFSAGGGTVGGVFSSSGKDCPANFSVATATRRSGNTNAGHSQLAKDRLKARADGITVAAGDLVDINDGFMYLVRNVGTGVLATGTPAAYASATAFDYANAFADGGANLFRLPKAIFDASRAAIWTYIDPRSTTNAGGEWVDIFQTIALPAGVSVFDYVQAEAEFIQLGGNFQAVALMLTAYNGSTVLSRSSWGLPNTWPQTPRAITLKPEPLQSRKLQVPMNCTHLDWAVRVYYSTPGGAVACPILVRRPLLVKTTPPGTIA